MAGTATNENLHKAKKAKRDEFYTRLSDIEAEIPHYKKHFKDKVVYCNCDNPAISNFVKYFNDNFEELQLKELLTCHFDRTKEEDDPDNGDFRSEKSIALLEKADIVVTNPPFSLFRPFMDQLIAYEKKFLVLGSNMAIGYKNIAPQIAANKIWGGINWDEKYYEVPNLPEYYGEESEDGKKYARLSNTIWYTNLDYSRRYRDLELTMKYDPDKYPKYTNFDAIEVPRTKRIPYDYKGWMGVPITFLQKYNPLQFEIFDAIHPIVIEDGKEVHKFKRLMVRNRRPEKEPTRVSPLVV